MSNSQSEERTHDLSRRKLLAAGAVGTAALGLSGAAKQAEAAEVGEFGDDPSLYDDAGSARKPRQFRCAGR